MANLAEKNKGRWDKMSIPAEKGPLFKAVADRLLFNKPRYEAVSKALASKGYTIPWEFIAVTHQRESSGNFNTYLGNGQPLNKKTTIVPKGRGPFTSWEEGAIDALVNAPPYAAKNTDWTIGGTLAKLEECNGLGYAAKGVPSPYLWAGTNQYVKGKYVRDGVYNADHVDTQLGCAGLLKFMGYGKASGGAVVAASAGTVAVGTTTYTFWDQITNFAHNHPTSVGLTAFAVVALVGLMIYAHKHKDDVIV
jgi:lysozyme family protein